MSEFNRAIPFLGALQAIVDTTGHHWWKDLLRQWRPSGQDSGQQGLRLAVRNGSLDLYRRGGRVALVQAGKGGEPYLSVHAKYVADQPPVSWGTNVRLESRDVLAHGDETGLTYNGAKTLAEWTRRAEDYGQLCRGAEASEKTGVDCIATDNLSVIDMEMGLPRESSASMPQGKKREGAKRIDVVALEPHGDRVRVVFWEAKNFTNPGLRSRDQPRVKKQLEDYKAFLARPGMSEQVVNGFRRTCTLLVELHTMARPLQPGIGALGEIIHRVAKGDELSVDPDPRIAIFCSRQVGASWRSHEEKLLAFAKIRLWEKRPYRL